MKQATMIIAATIIGASFVANAQALRADSKTIKSRAGSIERDYSRGMRETRERESSNSGSAIVVEEGFRLPSSQNPVIETQTVNPTYNIPSTRTSNSGAGAFVPPTSGFSDNQGSISTMTGSFNYPSNLEMRNDRKVGAGVNFGGSTGLAGVHLEFNFEDADGVIAGFGTGPGYNSFQLAWKHSFEGRYLTPYTTAGYSRWYNSNGRGDDYLQSDVLDRVLTQEERESGRFGTDFINGSLGLQYNQLTGDLAGVSVFGEITGMYEVKESNLIPNGSIGAIYFF